MRQLPRERFIQLRKEAGLTQQELADRIGMCREWVAAFESENPNKKTVASDKVMERWYNACRLYASEETKYNFFLDVVKLFKFHNFLSKK